MVGWHCAGGFSLDASVRIKAIDGSGLERRLRYCARPAFALEPLEQLGEVRFTEAAVLMLKTSPRCSRTCARG